MNIKKVLITIGFFLLVIFLYFVYPNLSSFSNAELWICILLILALSIYNIYNDIKIIKGNKEILLSTKINLFLNVISVIIFIYSIITKDILIKTLIGIILIQYTIDFLSKDKQE